LELLGLPNDCWDGISTSGEAGISAISELHHPTGFLGTREDRAILEGRGLAFVEEAFDEIAVTGLDDERDRIEDYESQLTAFAKRQVLFHCFNPDRIVIQGGVPELCAGALADAYTAMGGPVAWYGKPYPGIYRHALGLAGNRANRRAGSILQRQDAVSGGHAYSRHGAHTTMLDQQRRATNGVPPDDPTRKPKKCGPNSTRFLSSVDQLDAIQRGIAEMDRQGTNRATINMGRTIGEGYRKGGNCPKENTKFATVVRGPNGIVTAFPDLDGRP